MAEPRVTGTFADSVEPLPDLAPVKPTRESLEPAPTFGETYRASRRVGRVDVRSDFELIMLRDGYQPIVEALQLDSGQNPAVFTDLGAYGPKGEPMLMPSDLLRRQGKGFMGSMTNRATQEELIAGEIRARRAKDPNFLPGVPDTVKGLRAYFLENEKKKRNQAQAVVERSEGLSGFLANISGSAVESLHDPLTIATLPVGGGGRTLLQVVARESLVNGTISLITQPIIADNRELVGEELTLGEASANVVLEGLTGGALEGGLHLGGKGVKAANAALGDPAGQIAAVIKAAPASVRRRWASRFEAGPVEPIDILNDMDNRELAGFARSVIDPERMTDEERAAIATLERSQDVGEASPYAPGPAGDARHEEKLADAINDILENRRTREEPVAPAPVAGAPDAPERPPAASSTATARPQSPVVSGEAAIAGFKRKTRGAESGGDDGADNVRSSADGRYQITDGTFRDYHKRLFGTDPGEHPSKAVKNNPETQERIMDALTRDNAALLGRAGEAVTEGNLYLTHFLGPSAVKVLKADPDMPVERILPPGFIKANPEVLGGGKSASQVIAWAHRKMGGSASSVPSRTAAGELVSGEADPRIAQLREEALKLDDQIVGLTRLADGSPINLYTRNVPASAIGVDATRFQFKGGGDEFGVTERLKGVKEWDAGLAGRVTLWEDEAGKLWIADGHQRHGLARRISHEAGADVGMDAMVLRSADGISAEQARVWAALKNIAEGTGSAIDAAKVLRDAGMGALDRLPPKSPLVRDGAALARLSDEAFGAVYNERIPADFAATIGHLLPDNPETHIGMVDLLIKVDPANRAQAQSIVRQAIAAGFHEGEQVDLFGESSIVASLFAEKAKILERGLARLRKMRLVHKTAANEADELEAKGSTIAREQSEKEAKANAEAAAIIDRLAYRAGPVADALTDAARELANGGRLGDAADAFVARIRELDLRSLDGGNDGDRVDLDGAGREIDGGEAGPSLFEESGNQGQPSLIELEAATSRFSDPDGQAVKQQADSLEHDFKAAIEAGGIAVRVAAAREIAADAVTRGVLVEENELSEISLGTVLGADASAANPDYIHVRLKADGPGVSYSFPLAQFGGPVSGSALVKGEDGRPLIVYHGTKFINEDGTRFDRFDLDFAAQPGISFSSKREIAEAFTDSDNIIFAANLDMKNPLIVDAKRVQDADGFHDNDLKSDLMAAAREAGHDGLIIRGLSEQVAIGDEYVVFDPDQIRILDERAAANDTPPARLDPAARREKIRAASAALEGVERGELRTIEVFPDDEPGYHRFRYVAEDGTAVGGNYTIDGGPPPFLEGFNVGDTNNPVKLGAKQVRKLFAEIRRQHPEIERIHAFRMTGARQEAQELWIDLAGKGEGTKPEEVEIHAGDPPEEAPALDLGEQVDPAIAERQAREVELRSVAPLRAGGGVDQRGEIGLGLFDAADQRKLTFRLDEEGDEISAEDLLAELDADDKAIKTLRGCL